jgi:GT2 family glycosyltransferase
MKPKLLEPMFLRSLVKTFKSKLKQGFDPQKGSPSPIPDHERALQRIASNKLVAPEDAALIHSRKKFRNNQDKYWYRNQLGDKARRYLHQLSSSLKHQPLISIVIPVYNPNPHFLKTAIESVKEQIYSRWELVLVNDGCNEEVTALLNGYGRTSQIRSIEHKENKGVAAATNLGLKSAQGEYLLLMDHDDILERDALIQLALFIDKTGADLIYTDDTAFNDEEGLQYLAFKPDWSPELMLSYCYLRHLRLYHKAVIEATGPLDASLQGSQDYDYFLRASLHAQKIAHLPLVLYHWRNHPEQLSKKTTSIEAGRRAVEKHLKRLKIDWATVGDWKEAQEKKLGIYKLEPKIKTQELISIIIPFRNRVALLENCLNSVIKSTWENYEVILANDDSDEAETLIFLKTVEKKYPKVKVVSLQRSEGQGFNYAKINNQAIRHASGDYLVLLNSDTEILTPDWLEQMLVFAKIKEVGAVGAKATFPDGRLQHAGVIVHQDLLPAHHPFIGKRTGGYMEFASVARNYSAVTGACIMIKKEAFQKVNGFNEVDYPISSNDVDLCLRLGKAGYRIVYQPAAEITHHQGGTRHQNGRKDHYHRHDLKLFEHYPSFKDPFYNINQGGDPFFEVAFNQNNRFIQFPLSERALKIGLVVHNLNREGASIHLWRLAQFLQERPSTELIIFSPLKGALEKEFKLLGIDVRYLDFFGALKNQSYHGFTDATADLFKKEEFDLIYANTLDSFWAIDAAFKSDLPSIWSIHEDRDPLQYYSEHQLFHKLLPEILSALLKTNRNLFVCDQTKSHYLKYNYFGNMQRIYTGLKPQSPEPTKRKKLRASLGFSDTDLVFLSVGTICDRKGQKDLIKAAQQLEGQRDLKFLFLGKTVDLEQSQNLAKQLNAGPNLQYLGEVDRVDDFYRAADALVCTSYNESFPLVTLEAMSYGLPIISTTVGGLAEQLIPDESALCFEPGDIERLVEHILSIKNKPKLASQLSETGRERLIYVFSAEKMKREVLALVETVALEESHQNIINYVPEII